MVVEVDYVRSYVRPEEGRAVVYLHNPSEDVDYHSFPAYSEDYEGSRVSLYWVWENPEDPLKEITLSPSVKFEGSLGPNFHIYIRGGEVKHLSDCKCGCKD